MNKLRLLLVLLLSIILFSGCKKWGEPEFQCKKWVPEEWVKDLHFWTIGKKDVNDKKNILSKHTTMGTPDSITDYRDIRYVRAVVVSSDEGGNYYKSMVIQDSTGGVELELDMNGLYTTYPVGQKIILVCNGLVIGDYHSLPQIGWIYQGNQVGRINSLYFNKYIIKDGCPSLANIPKPLTNNEIDFTSFRDLNKLVRLEKVTFENSAIGKPLAFNDFPTEWKVYFQKENDTDSVTIRTSNYAKFRSMIIQNNTYNLTGILTVYQAGSRISYQLMIRTKDDIELCSSSNDESVSFDFTSDPIGDGKWSTQSLLGTTRWGFRNNSIMHSGNQGAFNLAMDDWFISPMINVQDINNSFLYFEHQLDIQNDNSDAYKIYYTTSNSAIFNSDEWKYLGDMKSFPANYEWSNRFDLSIIKSNSFRIAFRYYAPNLAVETYPWSIRKVDIRNK
ncbi:MAG: DUF5689 domain-containing protein [Bacteroidales bacterium]|jgi:hypothetical protein|nr:DUF5689 domain-containing protein [Bacteroidales bacterium]